MRPLHLARLWLCALLIGANLGAFAAASSRVLVVPSKDSGPYREAVDAIRSNLEGQPQAEIDLRVIPLEGFRSIDLDIHRPAVVVTIGAEAAQRVAQLNPLAPILHTLLPRETALELLRSGRGSHPAAYRDSAIFLDQPFGRQFDLLRLALPKHKRVAVILGPATQSHAAELRNTAREHHLSTTIAVIQQRDELLPTLETLLDDNDVLLSVPEPLAYHGETIHHVLLTTYRYKVPMIGLSKAYVDAGALLAIYTPPEQIGRQVAQVLATPAAVRGNLPPPSYPKYFKISINRRVAASLDLYLDSEMALQQKLEALTKP